MFEETAGDDALVGAIYDAVLVPDGWTSAVAAVAAALGCHGGTLLFQDRSGHAPHTDLTAVTGYPDGAAQLYDAHFAQQDDRLGQVLAAQPGQVLADGWTMDHAAFLRTELYGDFYRPFGMARGIGVRLFAEGSRIGVLSGFRGLERGPFDAAEIRLLERLASHLMRSLQLKRQLDRAVAVASGLASGLDRFPQAVLLLDAAGRVVEMNAAANAVLSQPGCPLLVREGRLSARQPADAALLLRAIHGAAPWPGQPPHMRVRLGHGAASLRLMAARVHRADRLGLIRPEGTLVFVAPGSAAGGFDPAVLAWKFGLSSAESQVAAALGGGDSVNEIADRRAVSRETVRAQVKSVLAKTGTTSQGKLIALVARSLAVLRVGTPSG